MSEKSPKSDSDGSSTEPIPKTKVNKPTLAMKFGLGKRKSSGTGDECETSPKSKKPDSKSKPIRMELASQKAPEPLKPVKKMTVAAAFGDDSDSDHEDMPPEAKMRMKNIGRETPTASGPNSFGKTKYGFTDTHRKHERLLKEVAKQVDG